MKQELEEKNTGTRKVSDLNSIINTWRDFSIMSNTAGFAYMYYLKCGFFWIQFLGMHY